MATIGSLPDTQNQAWKNDKSAFGYKMLQKMGWSEGKGLGKNQDGMTEHLRVRKREESLGLGAKVDFTGVSSLSSAVSDFNRILASLGGTEVSKTGKKRARSDSTDSSAASSTVESDSASDSSSDSDSGSDSSEGSVETPKSSGPTRFIGRIAHHKVLRQKNVSAYSAQDLQAILGNAPPTSEIVQDPSKLSGSGASVALPDAPVVQRIAVKLNSKELSDKKSKKQKKDKEEKKKKDEKKDKMERKKEKVKKNEVDEEDTAKKVKTSEKKAKKEKEEKKETVKKSKRASAEDDKKDKGKKKRKERDEPADAVSKKRKKDKK